MTIGGWDDKAADAALAAILHGVVDEPSSLSDDDLRRYLGGLARLGRRVDAVKARLAAEIAARSGRDEGHSGLAARQGYRNAETLVREVCGSSYREAAALVRVGSILASPAAAEEHGFTSLVEGVRAGRIELDAADGIVRALGAAMDGPLPTDDSSESAIRRVAPERLDPVVSTLTREAQTSHADAVVRMAKAARDTLDRGGIGSREERLRAGRYLHVGPEIDGMRRLSGLLDPESAAIVVSAVDAITAPRRGGPRFVGSAERKRASETIDDERSVGQLTLDAVVGMIRIAGDADDGRVFGANRPAVRVSITLDDLLRHIGPQNDGASSSGIAFLESSAEPMSAATARRYACDAGVLPVVFGGPSEILDVGRTRRLFTGPQRVALAERDGGCRWPGCDRPPSWTEAHHITPWLAGGRTGLDNGILLCRHHHLLLHNNGWTIARGREPGQFDLSPPGDIDPTHEPRTMPPKRRQPAPPRQRPPREQSHLPREKTQFSRERGHPPHQTQLAGKAGRVNA